MPRRMIDDYIFGLPVWQRLRQDERLLYLCLITKTDAVGIVDDAGVALACSAAGTGRTALIDLVDQGLIFTIDQGRYVVITDWPRINQLRWATTSYPGVYAYLLRNTRDQRYEMRDRPVYGDDCLIDTEDAMCRFAREIAPLYGLDDETANAAAITFFAKKKKYRTPAGFVRWLVQQHPSIQAPATSTNPNLPT